MILIADSGSTKTDWRAVMDDQEAWRFHTDGLNPFYLTEDQIVRAVVSGIPPGFPAAGIRNIYFYGAGCSSADKHVIMDSALKKVFPGAAPEIFSDLMGAARALFKREPGLVVNLGTGTFTAFYDGEKITLQMTPLGFILGDEASGAYFGTRLLRAYLNREMPPLLQKKFEAAYPMSVEEIKDAVYTRSRPNQFLASFTLFFSEHIAHPFLREMLREGFGDLFERQICKIDGWPEMKIRVTGSVAYHFADVLSEVARDYGASIDRVLKSPIDELVSYHTTHPGTAT